ncbi:hypothetical protein [Enhygromyxa salina]|uniref:hypothetical protein n=1 Tax=Enhygromyxa salina TaxID=215803 RepID=UPI0011B1F2C6|nr:hypothetical protein [Enhygromyxa salina]
MQQALALICTLVLAVGLVAGLPLWVWWLYPRLTGKKWAASAESLALTLDPYRPEHRMGMLTSSPSCLQPMRGRRGDFAVECGVRRISPSSTSNNYITQVRVTLPRSLDLGLHVRPVGLLGRAWTAVSGELDVQLADPELDRAYDISGDYDDRVQALLTTAPVADAMRAAAKGSFRPHFSDTAVWFERSGKQLSAQALSGALSEALDLGQRLLDARSQVNV